ncbi:MAG TPA: hypothetical protein VLB68_11895 [Pyrinomonadaceae bacterium]|nr:hypothetical protein [Pyrinomonadaceae bacterium]
MNSRMDVRLHIERLVLEGVQIEPRHHSHLQAALEAELTHLLKNGSLRADLFSGGNLRSVVAAEINTINVTMPAAAVQLGLNIAHAVYVGIGAPNEPRVR